MILIPKTNASAVDLEPTQTDLFIQSNFSNVVVEQHPALSSKTLYSFDYDLGNLLDDTLFILMLDLDYVDVYGVSVYSYDFSDNLIYSFTKTLTADFNFDYLINAIVSTDYITFSFTLNYDYTTQASQAAAAFSNLVSNTKMVNFQVFQDAYNNYEGVDLELLKTIYYNNGYVAGVSDGYDDGYADGEDDGYLLGETAGYSDGYDYGHTVGVSQGYSGAIDDFYTYGSTYHSFDVTGSYDYIEAYNLQQLVIDEKNVIITSKNTTINNLQNEIDYLESQLSDKDVVIANLQSQIDDLQAGGPTDSEVVTNFFGTTLGAIGSFFLFLFTEIEIFGVNLAMVLSLLLGLGLTIYLLRIFL